MLRVGLTGGLGCGKSTVAGLFREWGGEVMEADELGRELMAPGREIYSLIVEHFGAEVVAPDGGLNRARLAQMAFTEGRLEELNGLVHPAVLRAHMQWMEEVARRDPQAVAVFESAILFEMERDALARQEKECVVAEWRRRIDRVVVVVAPVETRIARYVARVCPDGQGRERAEADARARLAKQIPDEEKARRADFVLDNSGDLEHLREQAQELWRVLRKRATLFSA